MASAPTEQLQAEKTIDSEPLAPTNTPVALEPGAPATSFVEGAPTMQQVPTCTPPLTPALQPPLPTHAQWPAARTLLDDDRGLRIRCRLSWTLVRQQSHLQSHRVASRSLFMLLAMLGPSVRCAAPPKRSPKVAVRCHYITLCCGVQCPRAPTCAMCRMASSSSLPPRARSE